MINRKMHSKVCSYLEDKDLLSLRITCTHIYATMRNSPGICSTKTQFLIRVSGIYKSPSSLHQAWKYYKKVVNSPNSFPATLHKLRDPNVVKVQVEISKQFKSTKYLAGEDGRIYFPGVENGKHTWCLNYAWMLANIDIKRSFVIISDISDAHLRRSTSPDEISAFAKEIGMALEADYSLGLSDLNNVLILTPPDIQEKGYFVISKDKNISFFKALQKNKDILFLKNAFNEMEKIIEDNLEILRTPVQSRKDLTESFSDELLMDFADLCLVELKAVLEKYPALVQQAYQILVNYPDEQINILHKNIDENKIIDYLHNVIYQKFDTLFKKRLEEFDSPHSDTSSTDDVKDNYSSTESEPGDADVTEDVDGEIENLIADFGKTEIDERSGQYDPSKKQM